MNKDEFLRWLDESAGYLDEFNKGLAEACAKMPPQSPAPLLPPVDD